MKDTGSGPRPRLAIVSTFDDLCGIAGYTRSLVRYLDERFDIEVFDLDQFLMRGTAAPVVRLADEQIAEICARLPGFDCVNIQLEFGTLGFYQKDILRRFRQLIEAAPALSVTLHTILRATPFPKDKLRTALFKAELWNSYKLVGDFRRERKFRQEFYRALRGMQAKKPVRVIVHTRRDAREMSLVQRLESVLDHPLSFIPPERARALRRQARRDDFAGLAHLPRDARILGVFGFLGEYKGIHTAIQALHLLPEDHHLAIFGGLHPQEIRRSPDIHPYVGRLLGEIHVGETLVQSLRSDAPGSNVAVSLNGTEPGALLQSPRDISSRVHFLGAPSDDDLARAMAISDVAVLPYFEVGQTSSGPMSMALEMGARIVAARNHAFLQFARYHPGQIDFFEVGNHLELAQRIRATRPRRDDLPELQFTTRSNLEIYTAANAEANLPEPVDGG